MFVFLECNQGNTHAATGYIEPDPCQGETQAQSQKQSGTIPPQTSED